MSVTSVITNVSVVVISIMSVTHSVTVVTTVLSGSPWPGIQSWESMEDWKLSTLTMGFGTSQRNLYMIWPVQSGRVNEL